MIERYPGGREKLDEAIQGGELFQTIVYNPVSFIIGLLYVHNIILLMLCPFLRFHIRKLCLLFYSHH